MSRIPNLPEFANREPGSFHLRMVTSWLTHPLTLRLIGDFVCPAAVRFASN